MGGSKMEVKSALSLQSLFLSLALARLSLTHSLFFSLLRRRSTKRPSPLCLPHHSRGSMLIDFERGICVWAEHFVRGARRTERPLVGQVGVGGVFRQTNVGGTGACHCSLAGIFGDDKMI